MKQVWVKLVNEDRYSSTKSIKWALGTIVGEQSMKRYKDQISMSDTLSGETFWMDKRYLVETATEQGAIEVWASETYEQVPTPKSKGEETPDAD